MESWGSNNHVLGVPPHAFDGTRSIAKISAWGFHAAVLATDGTLQTWGDLQVPDGRAPGRLPEGVRDVDEGPDHVLYVGSNGQVGGWSDGDRFWGTYDSKTYTAVAAGKGFSVAVDSDGKVLAWGDNDQGQLYKPAALGTKTVTAVAAGNVHTLALTTEGKVYGWGGTDQSAAQVPADLSGVSAIDAGPSYSMAIANGKVRVWGNAGPVADVPSSLAGEQVVQIAAGTNHAVALTAEGKVYEWGEATTGVNAIPAAVSTRASGAIAAGAWWSVALTRQIMASTRPKLTLPAGGTRVGRPVTVTTSNGHYGPAGATIAGYQWQRDGVDIPGATEPTYQLVGADSHKNVRALVTVTKAGYGTDTFPTDTTYVETGTFETSGTPFIYWGNTEPSPWPWWDDFWEEIKSYPMDVGYEVAFNNAAITPRPEKMLIRWMVSDTDAPGGWRTVKAMDPYNDPDPGPEHSSDRIWYYTPKPTDYGRKIKVQVEASGTGMNPLIYDTAYFNTWVAPNYGDAVPAFEGDLNVGETIRPVLPPPYDWPGTVEPFQGWWFADNVRIRKASTLGDALVLTPELLGKDLRYELRLPDKFVNTYMRNFEIGTVEHALVKITQPTRIQGRPIVGAMLTAVPPVTDPTGSSSYQWLRDGEPIIGATGQTYRPTYADASHRISVEATVGADNHVPATSRSEGVSVQILK